MVFISGLANHIGPPETISKSILVKSNLAAQILLYFIFMIFNFRHRWARARKSHPPVYVHWKHRVPISCRILCHKWGYSTRTEGHDLGRAFQSQPLRVCGKEYLNQWSMLILDFSFLEDPHADPRSRQQNRLLFQLRVITNSISIYPWSHLLFSRLTSLCLMGLATIGHFWNSTLVPWKMRKRKNSRSRTPSIQAITS